eukprot:CAMPEP_0170527084 /NCGR_PEP_ID=MMETSP0209-20121228/12531_1 /TAXON_ID=665100 ORGANISM="Litonotus pictus, Strain P1" /NCGR_SAMPLE_ID=MMETSP0209 /ASSEMBLY_ACC=CAM_ASM_000301 /LENGTH=693 /DNA_ID=CAMNT_0010817355 /DNA_START=233 /DNA_END=2314 /DNA_ORIENTATION=+
MKNTDKLGSSKDVKREEIYEVVQDDLKNIYNFYKVVYLMVCDKFFSERLVSSFLFYMGELKKMKIIVNKKFEKEENMEKDAKEALRFYQYSLNKNPYNIRVYFNIGLIMRECLKDYTNSSYWFVRSLAAPGSEMKNLKDNLEMDFNIIRKIYNEKGYLVDSNPGYLNYDVEHLPLLLHRLMGIFYMTIDTDKIAELVESLGVMLEKVLKYYYNINEELKLEMETKALAEQISLMSIFSFHYTLNGLQEYPKSNERIIIQNDSDNKSNNTMNNNKNQTIKYEIYNHNILSAMSSLEEKQAKADKDKSGVSDTNDSTKEKSHSPKYGFKYVCQVMKLLIEKILKNYNQTNQYFCEKILVIFFYWFSINYDVLKSLILSDLELTKYLEFLNYKLHCSTEKVPNKEKMTQIINYYITPIEVSLFAFMPLTRFFEINSKKTILKSEDSRDQNILNKIILAHFLNIFGVKKTYDEALDNQFLLKQNELVTTTVITTTKEESEVSINSSIMNDTLISANKKEGVILNVKKVKPLILLDMSNIAMRHGNSERFSTKGIKICLEFFQRNGHEVNGFLPEYLFKKDDKGKNSKRIIPDDVPYLKELHSNGLVIQTPSQDYDDSYNIQYCKSKNAYFVTNDLYRDYIEKISDVKTKEIEKRWIIGKRISYTFNKDEFIPGPDSEFFKEFNFSSYLQSKTPSKED